MANTMLLFGEANSNRLYRVGKVGYDSGDVATYDPNSTPFTGMLMTERISPAGEDALVRFRRVALRAFKVGSWKVTMRAYVDDVRTQVWDNDESSSTWGTLIDQEVVIESEEEDTGEGEAILEMDIDATGTFIQVEVEISSTDIKGYFLPETIETHVQVIREAKSRATAESE